MDKRWQGVGEQNMSRRGIMTHCRFRPGTRRSRSHDSRGCPSYTTTIRSTTTTTTTITVTVTVDDGQFTLVRCNLSFFSLLSSLALSGINVVASSLYHYTASLDQLTTSVQSPVLTADRKIWGHIAIESCNHQFSGIRSSKSNAWEAIRGVSHHSP